MINNGKHQEHLINYHHCYGDILFVVVSLWQTSCYLSTKKIVQAKSFHYGSNAEACFKKKIPKSSFVSCTCLQITLGEVSQEVAVDRLEKEMLSKAVVVILFICMLSVGVIRKLVCGIWGESLGFHFASLRPCAWLAMRNEEQIIFPHLKWNS